MKSFAFYMFKYSLSNLKVFEYKLNLTNDKTNACFNC